MSHFKCFLSPSYQWWIISVCTTHEFIAEKCTWIPETCLETDDLSGVAAKKKKRKDQIQQLAHALWCTTATNTRVFATREANRRSDEDGNNKVRWSRYTNEWKAIVVLYVSPGLWMYFFPLKNGITSPYLTPSKFSRTITVSKFSVL